ncbi:Cytoplasmic dynein 2 heavy chain 1 [Chamberlinius hualienensis]
MSNVDVRKKFIITTIENYFQIQLNDALLNKLSTCEELNNFLDDANCWVLSSKRLPEGDNIRLTNKVNVGDNGCQQLLFFKIKPVAISPENLHQLILTSSMVNSPISALYHTIQKIYAPLLLSTNNDKSAIDPQVEDLLVRLEKELGNALQRNDHGFAAYITLSDELSYWKSLAPTLSSKEKKKIAESICEILQLLINSFEQAASTSVLSCDDLVQAAGTALDDLWKKDGSLTYSYDRMIHLFQIIGNGLLQLLQNKLPVREWWSSPFAEFESAVLDALSVCLKWIEICERLTVLFWPQYVSHPWKGKPFVPETVQRFSERLKQIISLRQHHFYLCNLLSKAEVDELNLNSAFNCFADMNVLQSSSYTETIWTSAVAQFEANLNIAEQRTTEKLKLLLQKDIENPLQLLQQFKRYNNLIERNFTKMALNPERAVLLGRLMEYLKLKKGEFMAVQSGKANLQLSMAVSDVVSKIAWARQLEISMKDVCNSAKTILSDLPECTNLVELSEEFVADLYSYQNEQFENWLRDVGLAIDEKTLSLMANEPVLKIFQDKTMQVTYNSRLECIIREVRQLTILGFNIPLSVKKICDLAKKFSKQAKQLQQIANFHNTIGDQMLASQRPLMLEAAIRLENIVQQQKGIRWNDLAALDEYIKNLQELVEKLSKENRRLRGYHTIICEKVICLMATDLIHFQQQWKDGLVEIRQMISKVEQQGYSKDCISSWKAHWDRQLYKALEHQFQLGLTTLHSSLPEIQVELLFRQRRLQFHPPFEEIKSKYYAQVKRFLYIPFVFKGVHESINEPLIFSVMIDRNASLFSSIYKRAEIIFDKLFDIHVSYKKWFILNNVNVGELIDNHLKTADDWDKNFRSIKMKLQEVVLLPNDKKVDCVTVSLNSVKFAIEDQIQTLWETMKFSLRSSINDDVNRVQEFLNASTNALNTRPQTVEEIGQANVKREELAIQMSEMSQLITTAEAKNKVLGLWVKERIKSLGELKTKWTTFEKNLEVYKQTISHQIEDLKFQIGQNVNAFLAEIEKFNSRWQQCKSKVDSIEDNFDVHLNTVKEKIEEFDFLLEKESKLLLERQQFGIEIIDCATLNELKSEVLESKDVWLLYEEFYLGVKGFAEKEWRSFCAKSYLFEEYLLNWLEKLDSTKVAPNNVTLQLLKQIDKYKSCLPLLMYCRGDNFHPDHWAEMFKIIAVPSTMTAEKLSFGDLLSVSSNIISNINKLKELNNRVQGEVLVRQSLNELDTWAVTTFFTLFEYADSEGKTVKLIKEWKDLLNKIGDHRSMLQSLHDSFYYQSFSDQVSVWENRLSDIDEYLHHLQHAQRKWIYLEPIFGRGALSKENSRFQQINRDFKSIMTDVTVNGRVTSLCSISNLRSALTTLLDQLQRCQKSLNDYLNKKRSLFPRFYFIGDDDLLEILGQPTNSNVIQAHLKKLFFGIHTVELTDDGRYIVGIRSMEGEYIRLDNKVRLLDEVEDWLKKLAEEIVTSLCNLLMKCIKEVGSGCDPNKYPQQILCLAEYIWFTQQCEEAISKRSLNKCLDQYKERLQSLTSIDVGNESELGVLRLKLKAIVLDTVYFVSVLEQLIAASISSVEDWSWKKQLRYYIVGKKVNVCMVDAEFEYTFEYQGNFPKLVHTPLTDKCYLTLTQAMKMGLGGNPYGPAGTGKTESVKALGNLLGRQVIVFNCDEGIDLKSMGKIFFGIVKSGAWGCFDEFNRLEEAVLSSVSIQIQVIQEALKNKTGVVQLLGKQETVNSNAGIFVTLNPLCKGYGGRQKLPDNLKQLFCPVVMSVPDSELIAEVLLYSEGFKYAKQIGHKLVSTFHLARELLTPQQHYDWGLRALKAVLRSCGKFLVTLISGNVTDEEKSARLSLESQLAVQALKMNTDTKLTYNDRLRFSSIIKDVFIGVPETTETHLNELTKAISESCLSMGLSYVESQSNKVVELYEQLQQRTGVVIVGPSGSGKSTLWKLLITSLNATGQQVKHHVINPKSMWRSQLLGFIDVDTREWTDGVLTMTAREMIKESLDVQSWVICDGDIDPEWIEALNSVLDDNRLLTMPSGERIQFGPNINFIFETHDLSNASPATISRMGVIYLSENDTDIKSVTKFWMNKHKIIADTYVQQLINDYLYKAVNWINLQQDFILEISAVGLTLNGLTFLSESKTLAEFALTLVKCMSANLKDECKESFIKQILSWFGDVNFPGNPFECYYNKDKDRIEMYSQDDQQLKTSSSQENNLILTPIMLSSRDLVINLLTSKERESFVLLGPEGCGKSTLFQHCLMQIRSIQVATINCTATTNQQTVISKMEEMCISLSCPTGKVYKPKECERLVLYFKNLNLVKPDKWGTCYLISFLQQLEWVSLDGIQLVGSIVPGCSLGRQLINPRFSSIVRIVYMSLPNEQYLKTICYSYLMSTFAALSGHPIWNSSAKVHHLAGSMVNVYQQLTKMIAENEHHQYSFSLRHLVSWAAGLAKYRLENNTKNTDGSSKALLILWVNEAKRVFRDALMTSDLKLKFDSVLRAVLSNDWGVEFDLDYDSYFSSFGSSDKKLVKLEFDELKPYIDKEITRYSRENQQLDLIIFPEILQHICRIDRVLNNRPGSAVILGPSGFGRRKILNLTCFVLGKSLSVLKLCRGYGIKHFKSDLKNAIQLAGIDEQDVVLLLEDHQLIDDMFVELINSVISTGEVPGLFTSAELDSLVISLKELALQEEFRGSLVSYFAKRVRQNLHIIFSLDSSNTRLPIYLASNPALLNVCSVICLDTWSKDSMVKIPKFVLPETISLDENIGEKFYRIHSICPAKLLTPTKYLYFVKMYEIIYNRKKKLLEDKKQRLQVGVTKLNEAKSVVTNLKSEITEQAKLLAEKRAEADKALDLITNSMQSAGDQKVEMEVLRDETMKENDKLIARKSVIEEELAEIEPLIKEAKAAVGNIKSESLSEIRSLRAPPDVIRDILEAVLNLMGHFDTSWNNMKNFLAKRGVKEEICQFDARNISLQSRESVEQLLKNRKDSFQPKNAKRASAAAAPLAAWVQANVRYSQVLNKIKPLEEEQAKLMRNLSKAESRMNKLSSQLDNVDRYVSDLRDQLNKSTKEAAELEIKLQKAEKNMKSAEVLVSKLNEEFIRWSRQVNELTSQIEMLSAQTLISAAFVTYLPSSTEDHRRKLLNDWFNIVGIDHVNLQTYLSSEKEILQWKKEGLPSDELFLENALIVAQNAPKPLLVDPTGMAIEWIKVHFKDNKLETVNQGDPNFKNCLEAAIKFGKILLVNEVNMIEPILFSLLKNDIFNIGARRLLQIGDKSIDYHDDFRLILATKNNSIEIAPQIFSLLTIINFTTTKAGLQGQLLAAALQHDRPDLEEKRSALLLQEEDFQVQLFQLEDSLLEQLATSKGDILENSELLDSLNQTKANCKTITESLNEFKQVQQSITEERNTYLPLVEFGGRLYFAVCDLVKINELYCVSLGTFLNLFREALSVTKESGDFGNRIKSVITKFQTLVYNYIARSLFKADHLTFALHLVHSMYPDLFFKDEWEAFTGTLVTDIKTDIDEAKRNMPSWVNDERALSYSLLKNIFPTLFQHLQLNDERLWRTFSQSSECEREMPTMRIQQMSKFQQVLVVQALRPDRLFSAMIDFCTQVLGLENLSPAHVNLKSLSEEGTAAEPILIMTSLSSDPSQELRETALKTVGANHYHQIAMGEGQADIALQLLRKCATNGEWLFINNVHLVSWWLPQLSDELASLNFHPKFRLWLTCESHFRCCSAFLNRCLRITFETPPGIKRNLQRTFDLWTADFFSKAGSTIRAQTLYMLAWFHATAQERLNYVPQGWTQGYEISYSDLKAAADIIDRLCIKTAKSDPSWSFIHGLFENTVYGGKIDNNFDVKVLRSYLKAYFNSGIISGTVDRKQLSSNIVLPISFQHYDYTKAIAQLSDIDKPAILGLPANIDNSAQRTRSNHVILQLRILLRTNEIIEKFDREKFHSELSPILNLWKKLNQNSKMVKASVDPPDGSGEPLTSVIQLEYFNAVKLVQYIHSTLASVSKVLRGIIVMVGDVAKLVQSLLHQEIPDAWNNKWESGVQEPLHYLRMLMSKALAVEKMLTESQQGSLLSNPINIAYMFYPERFLNAFRQQTAREMKISLDELQLVTSWKKATNLQSKLLLVLTGLYIEGCLFDGNILTECAHDSPSFTSVANVTIGWTSDKKAKVEESLVTLPVYQTRDRQKVITCLDVPCIGDSDKWIQCGAALFLQST